MSQDFEADDVVARWRSLQVASRNMISLRSRRASSAFVMREWELKGVL